MFIYEEKTWGTWVCRAEDVTPVGLNIKLSRCNPSKGKSVPETFLVLPRNFILRYALRVFEPYLGKLTCENLRKELKIEEIK